MENNRIEGNSSLLTQTLRINGQAITVQDVARRYLKWKAAAYRNTLLRGRRRIRKKSYAKTFQCCVAA